MNEEAAADRSSSRPTLYIFGAGGSGREVAWLASEVLADAFELAFVVDSPDYLSAPVDGIRVQLLDEIKNRPGDSYVIAMGDPVSRHAAARKLLESGLDAMTLVHPSTARSNLVEIGAGSIVCSGSILTTNVDVGEHVHVNVGCTVSHDVKIGAYSTLSPGVHIAGHVVIGDGVFIGIGAVIINGTAAKPLMIGDNAVIAAGACVTRDVLAGTMVAGVPATVRKTLAT